MKDYSSCSGSRPHLLLPLILVWIIGGCTPGGEKEGLTVNGEGLQSSGRAMVRSVRVALIVQDAKESGTWRRPEVRKQLQEAATRAILGIVRERAIRAITEADITRELRRLKGERQGERVRAFAVWSKEEADALAARRELVASLSRASIVSRRFPGTARHSTGDTGFVSMTKPGTQPVAVVKLALSLPRVGAVSAPTQVDSEWVVVAKTGYIPARTGSSKALRDLARRRLERRVAERAEREYIQRLERKAGIRFANEAQRRLWQNRRAPGTPALRRKSRGGRK